MITNMTQAELYSLLPAFRTADDKIFVKCAPFIQEADEELGLILDTYKLQAETAGDLFAQLHTLARRFVANRAAYLAIPHLDVVVTPNGAAVVSNQNLAPASAARVESLRTACAHTAQKALGKFCDLLLRTVWRDTDSALRVFSRAILPTAYYASQCGLYGKDRYGRRSDLYEDEFEHLQPEVRAAESQVRQTFGGEFVDTVLKTRVDKARSVWPARADEWFTKICVALAAGVPEPVIVAMTRAAWRFFDKNINKFPGLGTSPEYLSRKGTHYKNTQDSPFFVFG